MSTPVEECAICFDLIKPELFTPPAVVLTMLKCKHVFHKECIDVWIATFKTNKQDITCPMCRVVVKKDVSASSLIYLTTSIFRGIIELFPFRNFISNVFTRGYHFYHYIRNCYRR